VTTTLYRPAPILEPGGLRLDRRAHHSASASRLRKGQTLRVEDHYPSGVKVLRALVGALRPPLDTADHSAKQAYREAYRASAWRLLAPVERGRIALADAPEIGFLSELYGDLDRFWLPYPELRSLAYAWSQYAPGVPMTVLGHSLHPFYGTYLPQRTLHLELFATWLSRWAGAKDRAVDVGTGSGVLALMLARAGFAHVLATDINPNACESVRREVARRPEPPPVEVHQGDLLTGVPPADLIVFNPPWTFGRVDNLLDRALHYDDDLFERFFDQAHAGLRTGGRVVLVFSNVIRLVQPDVPHPVEAELERGRFRKVDVLSRRVKPQRGQPKPARRTRERVEVWELAAT
jgi:SAM-dependent methyltransferase